MYIEFDLLPDVDLVPGHSARVALTLIQQEMRAWSERYGIDYREKTIKYKHRITFDQDQTYSFWAMTWNVERRYYATSRYRIVSDLNNKI